MTKSIAYGDIVQAIQKLNAADPNRSNTFALSPELSGPISTVVFLLESFDGKLDLELAGKRYRLSLKVLKKRKLKLAKKMGRPGVDSTRINTALNMLSASTIPISEICKATGIGRTTLYRYAEERNILRQKASRTKQ